jgi:hypothetical protein
LKTAFARLQQFITPLARNLFYILAVLMKMTKKIHPVEAARTAALLLLLAYAGAGHAALGGPPEQFAPEVTTAVASATSTGAGYVARDTTLATGTRVREYVSAGGMVFAVSWEGPILPDLKALLGKYFDTMVAESARLPRAGRSQLAVDLPEVVIHSGGHMRAFEGSAWIPAQLPAGFSADDVR